VTFDPVPLCIICVRLGPSTPGVYVRARVLVPLKSGCDTSHNATLVTLIHETPRYKMMSPEEVLVMFLSHDMMVKDSKHIEDLDLGSSACAR
jgi:hypothetical protein